MSASLLMSYKPIAAFKNYYHSFNDRNNHIISSLCPKLLKFETPITLDLPSTENWLGSLAFLIFFHPHCVLHGILFLLTMLHLSFRYFFRLVNHSYLPSLSAFLSLRFPVPLSFTSLSVLLSPSQFPSFPSLSLPPFTLVSSLHSH